MKNIFVAVLFLLLITHAQFNLNLGLQAYYLSMEIPMMQVVTKTILFFNNATLTSDQDGNPNKYQGTVVNLGSVINFHTFNIFRSL